MSGLLRWLFSVSCLGRLPRSSFVLLVVFLGLLPLTARAKCVTGRESDVVRHCFGEACSDIGIFCDDTGNFIVSRGMGGYSGDEFASLAVLVPAGHVLSFTLEVDTKQGQDNVTFRGTASVFSGSGVYTLIPEAGTSGDVWIAWSSDDSGSPGAGGWTLTITQIGPPSILKPFHVLLGMCVLCCVAAGAGGLKVGSGPVAQVAPGTTPPYAQAGPQQQEMQNQRFSMQTRHTVQTQQTSMTYATHPFMHRQTLQPQRAGLGPQICFVPPEPTSFTTGFQPQMDGFQPQPAGFLPQMGGFQPQPGFQLQPAPGLAPAFQSQRSEP